MSTYGLIRGTKSNKLWTRLFTLVGVLFMATSCEMVDDSATQFTDIKIIAVAGAGQDNVYTDSTLQLKAVGYLDDEVSQDITEQVTWSSSSSDVATVSDGQPTKGLVTAIVPGAVTIQVVLGDKSATYPLTVLQSMLTGIKIDTPMQSFAKGTNQQLRAIAILNSGKTQDVTDQAQWSSLDTKIVSLSSLMLGQAQAVTKGTGTIQATYMGFTSTTDLTVTDAVLTGLVISPEQNFSLQAAEAKQFKATGTFSDATTQDVSESVDWVSSNEAVALYSNKMGQKGLLTAQSIEGNTQVKAMMAGISSNEVQIGVVVLKAIAISPAGLGTLVIGEKASFTAFGYYSDNSTAELTDKVVWTSSKPGVATISNTAKSGHLTAVTDGETDISAGFLGIMSSVVKIKVAKVVSISLDPKNFSILKKDTLQMKAYGVLSDGTVNKDITKISTWSSSDSKIVSVDSLGLATAEKEGVADMTAVFKGVTSTKSTITVTKK